MNAWDILCEVAVKHHVSVLALRSRCRSHKLVQVRIEIAERLRLERKLTAGQIGLILNRSTWTASYYLKERWRLQRQTKMRWKKRHENQRQRDWTGQEPVHNSRDRGEPLREL